jgi:enoyl-CoA hydratase
VEADREALVSVVLEGAVATVVINRPPLNLLGDATKAAITTAFSRIRESSDVRAVVLRGQGDRAFSAGADLREFAGRLERGDAYDAARTGQRMLQAVRGCGAPVLALIDGYAWGAGFELALAADLRLATERASFAFPEILRGVFPGNGGLLLLSQLVGTAVAKELMLLGQPIDAERALTLGLVNEVVAHDRLQPRAAELAAALAARPSEAVAAIRWLVDRLGQQPDETAEELQARLFASVFHHAAVREGVDAFLTDREPSFHDEPEKQ